jgi:hypothetical protein
MAHIQYNGPIKEIGYYIISLLLCFIFLTWSMQLWSADLSVPFSYGGDAVFEEELIKGVIDNGWLNQNNYVGMPAGLLSYDYPINTYLDFFLMKLISIVFPNWALTMNIFFLLTFLLTTFFTFFVLRQFKISPLPAIVGSLLYTFIPFHFLRGEGHLVLSSYFLIPLVVLVIFWVFEDDFLTSKIKNGFGDLKSSILNVKTILSIVICIGIASEFVYYPIFSCFFFLVAGICATISQKKGSPLLNAILLIGIIVLCIILLNLPSLFYQYENGKNLEVAIRSPAESEIYGLKIIQLFLPVPGHRIAWLSHISEFYSKTSPLVNENSYAALGVIGSIGFCILIFSMFYQLFTKTAGSQNDLLRKLQQLSVLNLSAVLLATVGGFGTVFAYLISPQIRAYNRVSIFIAFFCIVAVILVIDHLLQKYSSNKPKRWIVLGFIAAVLLIGIYDQTTVNFIPDYKNTKSIFLNDQHFIENIEEKFPNDTLVFQLPYVPYPENPPVNQMTDYDHFRAYLHSKNIHWSYGTIKGRNGDLWQKDIVSKSVNDMINNLSFSGFEGIYLDSNGYADHGNEMISALSSKLETTPIISENQRLYFFDMTKYNDQLKSQWNSEEFKKQKEKILNPLQLEWQQGFSTLETTDGHSWRWCSYEGTLTLNNPTDMVRTFLITTTFSTGYSEFSRLKIDGASISENLLLNDQGYQYQKKIDLPPGKSVIRFKSDAQRVNAAGDPRYLVFRINNFQIAEIE